MHHLNPRFIAPRGLPLYLALLAHLEGGHFDSVVGWMYWAGAGTGDFLQTDALYPRPTGIYNSHDNYTNEFIMTHRLAWSRVECIQRGKLYYHSSSGD